MSETAFQICDDVSDFEIYFVQVLHLFNGSTAAIVVMLLLLRIYNLVWYLQFAMYVGFLFL